jgi:hypothetical protein
MYYLQAWNNFNGGSTADGPVAGIITNLTDDGGNNTPLVAPGAPTQAARTPTTITAAQSAWQAGQTSMLLIKNHNTEKPAGTYGTSNAANLSVSVVHGNVLTLIAVRGTEKSAESLPLTVNLTSILITTATIELPANNATISGDAVLRGVVAPLDKVEEVRWYADNQLIATQEAANYPSITPTKFQSTWASYPNWANGTKTLTLVAVDEEGFEKRVSVSVTLNNSLVGLTRNIVTKKLPSSSIATAWAMAGNKFTKGLLNIIVDSVSANEFENYYCQLLVNVPGDSLTLTDYQIFNEKVATAILEEGSTFRLIVLMTPAGVRSTFAIGANSVMKFIPFNNGTDRLGALALSTNGLADKIVSLDGTTLRTEVDLSVFTNRVATDAAFFDGKWYVAFSPRSGAPVGTYPIVRAFDLDDTDKSYSLLIPDPDDVSVFQPTAIVAHGGNLWGGFDDGAGNGQVFHSGDGKNFSRVSGAFPGISRFYAGAALSALTINGRLYTVTESGLTLAFNSGETNANAALVDQNVSYLGTGTGGKLFSNRSSAWALESTLPFSEVLVLTAHDGRPYAAGNSGQLWRQNASGWANIDTLGGGVTHIYDMASFKGALYMATGPNGTIHRREAAAQNGAIKARKIRTISGLTPDVQKV